MDKLETAVTHDGTVTATFRDSKDFTATVTISREDLAKLVRAMEGGRIRSRFASAMLPDTDVIAAAGAYLIREIGWTRQGVIELDDWTRIWTAEANGWSRDGASAEDDAEEAHDQDVRIAQTGRR